MENDLLKNRIIVLTELLKVILWPILVLLTIIIFFSKPLYLTISELPNVLNNSESITIGELSLKIKKNSPLAPSKKVKDILKNISPQAIETLISSSGTTEYFHENEVLYGKQRFDELLKYGLYTNVEEVHLSKDYQNKRFSYGVQPTNLGIEVRKYLIEVLNSILKEI